MRLPVLPGIILVHQFFIPKLLARKIKAAFSDHIVTVIVSVRSAYPIHLAAKDILRQKSRDRTLSQCLIVRCPSIAHPRRTGICTPDLRQHIIQINGCIDSLIQLCHCLHIRLFPSIKLIFFHPYLYFSFDFVNLYSHIGFMNATQGEILDFTIPIRIPVRDG